MKNDLISRQAAIDALDGNVIVTSRESAQAVMDYIRECADRIRSLPSAQPDLDEWCTDCKEYDKKRNSCPRWNRVIKETLKDLQEERKTQLSKESTTSDCISRQAALDVVLPYCPDDDGTCSKSGDDLRNLLDDIENLPSVQPDNKDLIEKIQNGITASDGDNEYFIGLRNGMRWCLSLIDDKEPIYESSAHPEPISEEYKRVL